MPHALHRERWPLWLILALAIAPVLASTALYLARPNLALRTHGQLLVQPLPSAVATAWPAGNWVLLAVGEGKQSADSQRRFAMQQIRAAQGEAAERLQLQWRTAAAGLRADGFYLVDPQRNVVMFYRDGLPPTQTIREISRILKTNNGLA